MVATFVCVCIVLVGAGLAHKRINPRKRETSSELPNISLIVRLDHESASLTGSIAGLNSLDYPEEKIDIVYVCEGATDPTNEILKITADPMRQMVVLHDPGAKNGALNDAAWWAKQDILVFTTMETALPAGALKELVDRLSNSHDSVTFSEMRLCAMHRRYYPQFLADLHNTENPAVDWSASDAALPCDAIAASLATIEA